MKKKIIFTAIIGALAMGVTAECKEAGHEDVQELIVGDWYMGHDSGYNYMWRVYKDGRFQYLQLERENRDLGSAVTYELNGTYTLEEGILNRTYQEGDSEKLKEGSILLLDAEIAFSDEGDTLWMYYVDSDEVEYCQRLTETASINMYLGFTEQETCPVCHGEGTVGTKTESAPNYNGGSGTNTYEIPIFCSECGGLGTVDAD